MPLIGLLDDEVARVREAAMNALGEIADPRAVDPILPRLQDKDLKPRISAAIALGAIGNREAIPALIRSMGDPAPEVRLAAAAALEKLEEPLGRWIESALGDDPRGRQSLILANDARAVEPLIAALSDPDWKCRRAAAFALAGFKDERAQKELVRMAGKWNPRDRMLAIAALGEVERSGGFREIAGLVLKILLRPASLAYLFGVILLLFGTYRLARPRHP